MQKLRRGGVAAAVGVATLVTPLLTIQSAQAAGTADLTITKEVRTPSAAGQLAVPGDFLPELSDTRATGHYELTDDGLHLWTEGTTSSDKVAEYFDLTGPLPDTASLDWTGTRNRPGLQIVFDADGITGNGNDYNILVGEPVWGDGTTLYGDDYWLTSGSSATAKAAAPSCDGDPSVTTATSDTLIGSGHCTGGKGSAWHGTLADWKTALPDARMYAGGFSLGSGVEGDGVITALDYDAQHFTFAAGAYSSTMKAAPGATVQYRITLTNSSAATAAADNVHVSDVLPTDLTYVDGSLVDHGYGCSFIDNELACDASTMLPGQKGTITFRATLSDKVTSNGLPSTMGHNIDVQKQEVFADLPAGMTRTYSAFCPAGYIPTDGGLLIDAVDQGGFYSDIVVDSSTDVTQSGVRGWSVTATNLGDERGQGKVKVTCLSSTTGSSNSHTHELVVTGSTGTGTLPASSGGTVTRTCPSGYTPITPTHTVTDGIAVVRGSYAVGSSWKWVVDFDAGSAATFDVDCLAPETAATNGHTAPLSLTTGEDTVSIGSETRTEGIAACPASAHAITGGFSGSTADVLSLGKEQRGTNYMFRFYNDDWENDQSASIQVTCVGVRTADEPTYYHVRNTATVSTTSPDASTSDNSSTADVAIAGDPNLPAAGLQVNNGTGKLVKPGSYVKSIRLNLTCAQGTTCSFTVKVVTDAGVVAKKTASIGAGVTQNLWVPTTSLGKNLHGGDEADVKLKSPSGTSTFPITLVS